MTIEIKAVVKTSSGMLALWDAEPFAGVVDYDTWEAELCLDEDIQSRVLAGDLVPINIESDGAFEVLVRYGSEPVLTEREIEHLVVSSEPYLLVSSGDVRSRWSCTSSTGTPSRAARPRTATPRHTHCPTSSR
jgi:hypothetical protein